MRTEKSIKNSLAAIIVNISTMIIGFIAQAIFIRILGAEYLGLNGLFNNILSMLAIAELGIGNAIIFSLYKPLVDDDKKTIAALMIFYKKAYNIVLLIVSALGICIMPFLKYIVGEVSVSINIYIVYILYLLSSLASYFLTYKRSILYADQKKYIINYIHTIYLLILNFTQLLVLYLTKNYYIYIVLKIVCQIGENIILNLIVNKQYPYLKKNISDKISDEMEKNIFQKIKGLFFHKVGNFLVWGTDNILLSYFFGVIQVGIYSNYSMIINAVTNLFQQFISSTSASIGNLLVEKNNKKTQNIFQKIYFLNFWIVVFASNCILIIIQPFVKIWVGEQYLLPLYIVIVLIISFYQKMMRVTYDTFKESAGIWHEDRFIPILESVFNIVFSIIFAKCFGLVGIFLGTIVSGFVLWFYSYPKFVFKKILSFSIKEYTKINVKYFLTFSIITSISFLFSTLYNPSSILLKLLYNILISLTIPNILMLLIFFKDKNFKYFIDMVKKISNKIKKVLIRR
jgi:putative membrane protein